MPSTPPPVLETARLSLRPFTADDADFVLALLNEPDFHRFIGDRGVRTPDDARSYIRDKLVASYGKHGYGLWHVSLRANGTAVGMCGLVRRDYLADPDVGFAFLARFAGRGYATESATAVVHHARTRLGLGRLHGITDPANAASQHVLRKVGLRFDREFTVPGATKPSALFTADPAPAGP